MAHHLSTRLENFAVKKMQNVNKIGVILDPVLVFLTSGNTNNNIIFSLS